MKKYKKRTYADSNFELLSDISLSTLGLFLIVFVVYALIFNSKNQQSHPLKFKAEIERLENEVNSVSAENKRLSEENSKLRQGNARLTQTNSEVIKQNTELSQKNSQLNRENSRLNQQNADLAREKSQLDRQNSDLVRENSQLAQEKAGAVKRAENAERRAKLVAQQHRYTGYYTGEVESKIYYTGCGGPTRTITTEQSIFFVQESSTVVHSSTFPELGTITMQYIGTLQGNIFRGKPEKYSRGTGVESCGLDYEVTIEFYDDYLKFSEVDESYSLRKVE